LDTNEKKLKNIAIDPWLLTLKQYELLKSLLKGSKIRFELVDKNLIDEIWVKKKFVVKNKIFEISLEGFHNASNFLFAYAVAKELGIDFASFNKFDFAILGGRNKILKSVKTTIYDESYNASPESVKACIKNLLEKPRNKFFIFGSMLELGEESEKYHKEIFNLINNSDIEKCLFICDKKNEKIYTNYLKDKKKFLVLNNIKDVPKEINKSTKKGDSILIKGSRCWQLEKIIELIN